MLGEFTLLYLTNDASFAVSNSSSWTVCRTALESVSKESVQTSARVRRSFLRAASLRGAEIVEALGRFRKAARLANCRKLRVSADVVAPFPAGRRVTLESK